MSPGGMSVSEGKDKTVKQKRHAPPKNTETKEQWVEMRTKTEYNMRCTGRAVFIPCRALETKEVDSMEIRAAVYEDIPALLKLYRDLFEEAAQLQPYNFQAAEPAQDSLKKMIDAPDSTILVAVQDASPVGFAVLAEQKTPALDCLTPHRYAYLMDLVVSPELREIGIGSGLLDAAKDWARARGLDHIELNVLPENKGAVRLYERNGFEPSLYRMQYRF